MPHNQRFPATQQLPIHEWMAVVAIITLLLTLTFISYETPAEIQEIPCQEQQQTNPLVAITVEGAVKYPGIIQVEKGTPIRKVLAIAEPLPTANLKKLKLDGKATRRRKILIQEK